MQGDAEHRKIILEICNFIFENCKLMERVPRYNQALMYIMVTY